MKPRENDAAAVDEGSGILYHGNPRRRRPRAWWTLVPLVLGLILCLSVTVEAGMVYGRVYGAEDVFKGGDAFELEKKGGKTIEVKTDESRGYSIILEPGIYRVRFKRDGTLWEAWIQSSSGSLRQDIHLKRK